MDLFSQNFETQQKVGAPLAEKMRPTTLEEVVGQPQLIGHGKPLTVAVTKDRIPSMILYGPPGCGKTSLAKVIANYTHAHFEIINAVTDGIPRIKEVVKIGEDNLKFHNQKTIVFIDEIHRFNKAQQDALLPFVENGLLTLIGATTENPYVELNRALLSRLLIFPLKKISEKDIITILESALINPQKGYGNLKIYIDDKEALFEFFVHIATGDIRRALNGLENLIAITPINEDGSLTLTLARAEDSVMEKALNYDKKGDNHYDVISAFIKSVRGSDTNGAVHYLARMIAAGEDPMFIARRLVILASEDIGLADPNGLIVATNAMIATEKIGLPEARIILSEATIYLAKAKKSNSAYLAIDAALRDIKNGDYGEVPYHLRDHSFPRPDEKGQETVAYQYPHDYPETDFVIEQQYLPDVLKDKKYYKEKKLDKN
ncbi:AAA family ATPase [endosymbiont 'TC1' of Trimyema compressum]|uniref:replication-associated recombination protein A n=1 Tax=endosymbiont 'TC1' of Trimyema compressum TaxID=243899 RepID=UPI0007F0D810|nr:replication-associated recombination protein A [endosymbiont 'TC1' of Trimyema compressum]AMP20613.1 AAA family ATPase [endosymbiont 'TC1' of Trimyema compressum]